MPQQFSVDEFADQIRKKYPGAYDSLGNQDLVNKVIEKYPVYKDHIKTAAAPEATPSTPKDVRQGLAQAIAQAEGFNTPGTIPQRQNNPGDLRPVGGGDIRTFATPEE